MGHEPPNFFSTKAKQSRQNVEEWWGLGDGMEMEREGGESAESTMIQYIIINECVI